MSSGLGTVVAVVVGALIAVGGAVGLVSAQGSPDPVNKPLVVYGER
jgi:hypothetical protein